MWLFEREADFLALWYLITYLLSVSTIDANLSCDDTKAIRRELWSLVKSYIAKDVTADELSHILGFLVTATKEQQTQVSLFMLFHKPLIISSGLPWRIRAGHLHYRSVSKFGSTPSNNGHLMTSLSPSDSILRTSDWERSRCQPEA